MRKLRQRVSFIAAALVTAVPALVVAGAPAQADAGHEMNIWSSSHCLDNATQDFTKLQMWNCTGGSEQKWIDGFNTATGFFTFQNENTGNCITAPASGPDIVTMTPCDANPAVTTQRWNVYFADNPDSTNGWFDVWQNVASGQCLKTLSVGNGTQLRTWPCDSTDHYQKWHEQ